ncbi:MAG: TIGR04211 family SH3 domain-containing protein [Methylobacter sp.]
MKKIISSFFMLMVAFGSAQAETVYVSDNLGLSLRSEENNTSKAIQVLPTGTPLTVLEVNKKTGFSHVRLDDGTEGYMPTRNTMKDKPSRFYLDAANKELESLKTENMTLTAELSKAKEAITPGSSLEKTLSLEKDQLSKELNELKKTSSGAIELQNQRDELQERVVNAERELQQLKLENQAMRNSANQDWFLYGGILALFGVLLGFLLPKLSSRRRSGGWDTF